MITTIVSVLTENVKTKIIMYCCGLIVTQKKKTCTEIAKTLSVNHDIIYSALCFSSHVIESSFNILLGIVNELSKTEQGWLIIDDTALCKPFSRLIEGIEYIFNTATSRPDKGFSIVVIAWTNGNTTIPLGIKFWFPKKIVGPENYKTKLRVAKEMVREYLAKVPSKGVLMDGLYAFCDMFKFFNDLGLRFNMRMGSNRVIELPDGTRIKLRDIRMFHPQRNARSRSMWGEWKGLWLHFTSELRINKHGEKSLVFIVSNYQDTSKNHVNAYKLRWPEETVFRTTKQSLGLQHCQTRQLKKLETHVCLVFLSYAFLQVERHGKKSLTVEAVIRKHQDKKYTTHKFLINRFRGFFNAYI